MLSALSICIVLYYEKDVTEMWNGCMMTLAEAIIVILAVLAQLASVAYKIAIEKDWIVVIAAQNKSALASEPSKHKTSTQYWVNVGPAS